MALSGDTNSHPLTTAIANQFLAIASKLEADFGNKNNTENSLLHSASPHLLNDPATDVVDDPQPPPVATLIINNKSTAVESVTTDFVANDDVESSPLVLYIAVFVSLGGVIVVALVAVLIWCWCRRLASRDKRLLGGVGVHGSVEGNAVSEAQKKEALFKEIRRDIAAVENDGFLRHLEVYMLPQQQGASGDTGWEYHPKPRVHHHHHHPHRHSGGYHRNSPFSTNNNNQSNSNAFLVTSPLSSSSGSAAAMITRSSTMTTTASSLSSYSSASSTGSGSSSHRNHIPKRNCGYGPPSIHDKQWDEEDDDDLVDEN